MPGASTPPGVHGAKVLVAVEVGAALGVLFDWTVVVAKHDFLLAKILGNRAFCSVLSFAKTSPYDRTVIVRLLRFDESPAPTSSPTCNIVGSNAVTPAVA